MGNRLLKVLSIRPFLFLWLAEIFTQIAINMVNFALIVVAFNIAKSNTAVSGIVLSFTLPAIFFGILAGVYVDRWNKKQVLLATNILRAALLFVLASFHTNLAVIYFISFLIAMATQFFIPAETPMIPLLVPKNLLLSANALFGLGIYGSILVAYALSGPFIILLGNGYIFAFLGIFFLVASLFATFIRIPHKASEIDIKPEQLSLSNEIKHALSMVTKKKAVYQSLILLTLAQVLFLIVAVIGPGFADETLHVSVSTFPIIFITPATIGMIIGALLLGYFFHNRPKQLIVNSGIFLSAFGFLILPTAIHFNIPFLTPIHITIMVAFLLGFANALVFIPSNTIVQEETVSELRGRVYGLLSSLVGVFSLFPIIIAGGLSDIFGVAAVLRGIGVVIFLLGLLRVFF